MADSVLDVFNQDAFSFVALTDAINRVPFTPFQAGKLGIFTETGVATTKVELEQYDGVLDLVPNTPRGGAAAENKRNKRVVRSLTIPHFPLDDNIFADEVQNVRVFGSSNEFQGVQAIVDQRFQEMVPKLDATLEYGRIGAIKGIIYDSDGSTVIYNLFTEFGITQSTVDFTFGTTTTDIHGVCSDVLNQMETNLGAATWDHIHVFCGKTWFKSFIGHANVQKAYTYFQERQQMLNPMRDDVRYDGFTFGGLTFEQYRGTVNGVGFVADNEAYAFPVGVPMLFRTYFAPGDYVETANTIGLPRYAKQALDPKFQKYVSLEVQTNPLSICSRPEALIKLYTSN